MVTLTQVTTVNCKLATPVFNVMSSTFSSIPGHSLGPGGPLCGVFATTYGMWNAQVVPASTTEIDILVGFNQASPCTGTIQAAWDNATHTAAFNNITLMAVTPGQPNCVVSGWISVPTLQIL